MSRHRFLKLLAVTLWLCAAPCSAEPPAPDAITFLTHSVGDQGYVDDVGQLRGREHGGRRAFNLELVREMMALTGQVTTIEVVPFKRGLQLVQSQPGYAFFNVNRTAEREGTVRWVGPLQRSTTYLYENKAAPTGIESLDDARRVEAICVLRGNVHHRFLEKQGFENIYPANHYANCIDMLELKRVDLTPLSNLSSLTQGEQVSVADFLQQTPVTLMESEGYLAFSKETPDEVIDLWQAVFDRLVASGRYADLVDRYLDGKADD